MGQYIDRLKIRYVSYVAVWTIRILVWSDKCQSEQEIGRSSADIDQTIWAVLYTCGKELCKQH